MTVIVLIMQAKYNVAYSLIDLHNYELTRLVFVDLSVLTYAFPCSTRMMEIQSQLSERAIELLALPEDTPCFLLDVGCGSGLSGEWIVKAQ